MTTYYVATSGNNANSGAIGSPWATISYALSASSPVAAGDIILVRGGTYNQHITPTKSGSSGNPITVKAYTGETPVLAGASGTQGIMTISGVHYLTFGEGLRFSYGHSAPGGVTRFPWILLLSGGSIGTSNIIFENFQMERAGWENIATLAASTWQEWAIQIENATQVTCDGLWIRGTHQGIQIKNNAYDATIKNCDIGHTKASCITLTHSNNLIRRVRITGNKLHDSATEDGIQFMQNFDDIDDSIDNSNKGTRVDGNWFYANAENAIDLKGASYVVIEGNHIFGTIGSNNGILGSSGSGWNRNSMGAIIRGANTYSDDVIIRHNVIYDNANGVWPFPYYSIYNNTFVFNNRDYTGPDSTFSAGNSTPAFTGIRSQGAVPGIVIRNNIFSGHKNADVAIFAGHNTPNWNDIDYNLYVAEKFRDRSTGTLYTTLASWQNRLSQNNWPAPYGKEGNSISIASQSGVGFVNVPNTPTLSPDNYDFGILESSPAYQTGGPLTYTTGTGSSQEWLTVTNAHPFTNGHGRSDTTGDPIFVNGQARTVIETDYTNNRLRLNATVSWSAGQPVWYGTAAVANIGATVADGSGPPPPPPPPATGRRRVVVRVAAATSTGNQDIPIPAGRLGATPSVFRFKIVGASADDTPTDHVIVGMGWAWDNGSSIVQGAVTLRSRHGVNPASANRRNATNACIILYSTTSSSIIGQATFVSGTATNVRINWSTAPGVAYHLIVEALAPDAAYFGPFAIASTVNTSTAINTGFRFSEAEVVTVNNAQDTGSANHRFSWGWATHDGTTLTQAMFARNTEQVSPTTVFARLSNTQVGGHLDQNGSFTTALQIENVDGSGFDIKTVVGGGVSGAYGFVLAMYFAGFESKMGLVALPTSADSGFNVSVGFEAGWFEAITTHLQTLNSNVSTGDAGSLGWGGWDGESEYGWSLAEEDAATTSNTQMHSHQRLIDVDTHTGGAGLVGAVASAGASNTVLNISGALSPARYMLYMATQAPAPVVQSKRVLRTHLRSGLAVGLRSGF